MLLPAPLQTCLWQTHTLEPRRASQAGAQPRVLFWELIPCCSLSSRSRQCCRTRMTRRITGSGRSSTWTPLTCAFPPWPLRLHRGKSMLTAWMSTSEGRVRTPCTCALAVSSCQTLPQPLQGSSPTALPVPCWSRVTATNSAPQGCCCVWFRERPCHILLSMRALLFSHRDGNYRSTY